MERSEHLTLIVVRSADDTDATVLVVYSTHAAFAAEGATVEQKDTSLRPHSSSVAGDNSQKKG